MYEVSSTNVCQFFVSSGFKFSGHQVDLNSSFFRVWGKWFLPPDHPTHPTRVKLMKDVMFTQNVWFQELIEFAACKKLHHLGKLALGKINMCLKWCIKILPNTNDSVCYDQCDLMDLLLFFIWPLTTTNTKNLPKSADNLDHYLVKFGLLYSFFFFFFAKKCTPSWYSSSPWKLSWYNFTLKLSL